MANWLVSLDNAGRWLGSKLDSFLDTFVSILLLLRRIHPEFPYIDAEVRYAVREYAATVVDILARR